MDKTKIDWCQSTWNPISGCLHGCEYCYARNISERFGTLFKGDILPEDEGLSFLPDTPETFYVLDEPIRDEYGKIEPYPANFYPTFHRYHLNDCIGKKGRNIFVCSMADLFGKWVPDSWIEEVFNACEKAPQHNYMFLTKNPVRYSLLQDKEKLIKKPNMWYGNSITNKEQMEIADYETGILGGKARTFYSIEPLLEDITDSKFWKNSCGKWYMDWVIIGAETGRRKDKVAPERKWIENIINDCEKEDIPVFMKSSLSDIWGEPLIQEFPEGLRKTKVKILPESD